MKGAPTPEPERSTPAPTLVHLEVSTCETVQPPGSVPSPTTDSSKLEAHAAGRAHANNPERERAPDPQSATVRSSPGSPPTSAWGAGAGGGGGHDVRGSVASALRVSHVSRGSVASARRVSPKGGHQARTSIRSNSGAGFRDKLEALSAVHDLEVGDLRDEVARLQDLIGQYRSLLDKAHSDHEQVRGDLRCAASDGATRTSEQEMEGEVRNGRIQEERESSRSSRRSSDFAQVDADSPQKPVPSSLALPMPQPPALQIRISQQAAAVLPPASGRATVDAIKRKGRSRKKELKGSAIAMNMAQRTRLQRLIDHSLFDLFCALMIVINSIIIGFEVQWHTTNETEPETTKVLQVLCSSFFCFELVVRVLADGAYDFFVLSDNRNWNWFDFALVVISFFDVLSAANSSGGVSSIGMGSKSIKMLRIIRVVRVFRFFRKLSHLAFMIVDSVKSLFWALIMLGLVIYVFAIFFTHYTTEHLRTLEKSDQSTVIEEHFGDLWTTLYTLYHSMLNGISWYRIPHALIRIPGLTGPVLAAGFCFYLAFTMLAVMNIITGVFVDNAVETARTQRDFLVQREMEVKEMWLKEMRTIFMEMDSDNSETVNKAELHEFCNDDRVQYYLTALELDVRDTHRLFELLDANRDGEIQMDEFLDGCLRLKGAARSIDVCSLIHQTRQLCKRLEYIDMALYDQLGIRKPKTSWLMTPLSARGNGDIRGTAFPSSAQENGVSPRPVS